MIDHAAFQSVEDLHGEDNRDTTLLKSMAIDAKSYIESFRWAPHVKGQYLAFGVGGIVAIFLIDFVEKIDGTDDQLWVIVGDLPNAYLVADAGGDPRAVLERYCELMTEWAESVIIGTSLEDVFPIGVEPTIANARALQKRMAFLRDEVLPGICPPNKGIAE